MTFVAKSACQPGASIASTRIWVSRMPALFTSAVEGAELAINRLEQPHDLGLDRDVGRHADRRRPRP